MMKVSIGVSNRHVHLTKETLEDLFGKGYELENVKNLNQPEQFASNTFVTLKTDKGLIEHARVLGPVRNYNQVEISKTDAYKLGLNPPIRESGDITGSESITLVSDNKEVKLNEGCILATRHIHILPEQVKQYGLDINKKYCVRLSGEKGGIIENVSLKVSDKSYFELHIDTDDANAHLVKNGDIGEIL